MNIPKKISVRVGREVTRKELKIFGREIAKVTCDIHF